MKRSVLQLILQGCNDDIVSAIEHVLNDHGHTPAGVMAVGGAPNIALPLSMRPMLAASGSGVGPIGMKSAFSPITTVSATPTSAIRYPYPGGQRALPFPLPYPASFFPSLAPMGYGYNAALAAAVASSGTRKVSGATYSMCCPYGTSTPDK